VADHSEILPVAEAGFAAFAHGLATGKWSDFLNLLSDDFTFWFPAGPFQGWNRGKDQAAKFLSAASQVFAGGLTVEVVRITQGGNTVVFEVKSQGQMLGHPYQNQAAIAFEVQGEQIIAYREYLGVIFQLPPKEASEG
jgi:ketosteroid isomerase-like protein